MTRNVVNFVIDSITALVMAAMVVTGLVIRYVLPAGTGRGRSLWGYGRHEWGDVHFWLALAAVAGVLLHLALHWQWVCATCLRLLPGGARRQVSAVQRKIAGVAVVATVITVFAIFVNIAQRAVRDIPAALVEGPEAHVRGSGSSAHDDTEAAQLRGSMTLAEAAQSCGMSVTDVRVRLGVRADEPEEERLGQIAKKYGFSPHEAREKLLAGKQG